MNDTYYPLSNQQKGIWYIEQIHEHTSISLISATIKLTGKIDYTLLAAAINKMIEQEANIRMRIKLINSEPFQYYQPYESLKIDHFDLSGASCEEIENWKKEVALKPFNLIDSGLFYFATLRLGNDCGGFLIKLHHIVSDGWSSVMIINRIMSIYNQLLHGTEVSTVQTPPYTEYLEREKNYLESVQFEKDSQFWQETVKRIPEQVEFKADRTNASTCANRISFYLEEPVLNQIKNFCKTNGASIFSVFFSLFSIYIMRMTGRTCLSFGTPVLNRKNNKEKNTVGMFISAIPLILNIDENVNFASFNQEIIKTWFSVLRHQQYPYEQIFADAKKVKGPMKRLYDITISYQNAMFEKPDNGGVYFEGEWHFCGHQVESLCMHINEREADGKLCIDYDYLTDVFTTQEIERMHQNILNIAQDVLTNPFTLISKANMLSEAEKLTLLKGFNETSYPYEKKSIHALIEEQSQKNPNAIAVVYENKSVTYGELNDKAARLASILKGKGLKSDAVIGIMLERSADLVVTMLAVLKAGGAFLPVDPTLPNGRISYILKDSEASFVLTHNHLKSRFEYDGAIEFDTEKLLYVNEETGVSNYFDYPATNPHSLAYVIYTSGSTGEPKGVMVEHRSVANFHQGLKNILNCQPGRTVLSIASVGFDVFIFETLLTLMSGMKIVLAGEKDQKDTLKIADLIYKNNVNKIYLTPSRLRVMLADSNAHKALALLDEIVCGGESFPPDLYSALQYITKAEIYNQYGPTEATIGVTIKKIESPDEITIGRPMANVHAYIFDRNLNLMPAGVYGDLYIGGDCLSRGYIGNNELTKEKFIENPYLPSEKIYKTGDIAKWLPNGELDFAGRADTQIKIRGFRVELQEIENKLSRIKGIKSATVIDRTDQYNNKYLCAYYLSDTPLPQAQIKQQLQYLLPHYMVPAFYIRLENFPLNANGKIDTALLPPPVPLNPHKNRFVAPQNAIEQQLIEIWQNNLKINELGVTDNYFALGGDSLSLVMLLIEINKVFNTALSFNHLFDAPTIRNIAKCIKQVRSEKTEALAKAPVMPHYPLSSSQVRLYILNGIDRNKTAYNMPGAFIIQGKLDVVRLEQVFNTIISRYDILRTSFDLAGTDIVQTVHSEVKIEIEKINAVNTEEAARLFIRPFDLSQAPLFRAGIVKLSNEKHLLLLDMHHIISDGTSSAILMEEINTLYSGGVLNEVEFQYKDYVLWAQKNKNTASYVKQREYWLNEFKDTIPILELPLDFPRPPAADFKGKKMHFALDKNKTSNVVEFCKEHDVSLFMFLFSIWDVLLSKITGQYDIIVGTPVHGRQHPGLEKIMGVFINTLPIRTHPDPDMTYLKFLEKVKQKTLYALNNQDYPYDQLMDSLPVKRDLSRNPLFDTLFVFQNVNIEQMKIGNLSVTPEELDLGISKLDLTLEAVEYNEKLHFSFEYATSLFEEKTIIKYIGYFEALINNIMLKPNEKLINIECITENERRLLLVDYNNTDFAYDPKPVDAIFDQAAAQYPDKTAVVFHNEKITFAELKQLSDSIATKLKKAGIAKGNVVGLLCRRSIEMIAGIFGIMKAGAIYMPIEPDYPGERQKYMLEDSKAAAIVYSGNVDLPSDYEGKSIEISMRDLAVNEKPPIRRHKKDDCIYVLYTSGSTGKPKGVMIRHQSVTNFYYSMKDYLPYEPDDTVLCSTTFCFDVFALESIIPLAMGLTIIMVDEEQQRLPWLMAEAIKQNNVTFLQVTPSRMRILIEDWNLRNAIKKIRIYASVGEALPLALLKKLQAVTAARIFDLYGPTETTIYSTVSELTHADHVHIGRPIHNTHIYVLNEHLRLLPPGAVGELYIGGDGVATGYINNDKLTAEKFIPDPFKPDAKIYKTGDLVRYEKDGNLFYLSRSDNQVKVRGFRIELGEIENCIMSSGMVTQAVVVPVASQEELVSLYAYLTASETFCDINQLKLYISKHLPEYMVPSQFVLLDKIPLNTSGKIDRKSLPKPAYLEQNSNHVVFPRNSTEKMLFNIWTNVLKNDSISIDRSFFEMGGDSLSVIIVQMQYYKLNLHISTKDFYNYQTIAEQAEIINNKDKKKEFIQATIHYPSLQQTPQISAPPKLINVLITGATGFLGSHIVKEIVNNSGANVYCIVRGENPDYKLSEALKYYHGMPFVNKYRKRIYSVKGDIEKPHFGLSYKDFNSLAHKIDTVIHCAADVRHYGKTENFFATNVEGTNQIIEFCSISRAHLFHVSTVSVAGNKTTEEKQKYVFSEKDFFIGQNYQDNEYVKSKFEAERLVIQAMQKDIKATILRVGNLTGRYKDGVFQKNINSNAFYQRLRALIMLKCIPDIYRQLQLEFTPVDICAKAAVTIIASENTVGQVYHLKNHNTVQMSDLISYFDLPKRGFQFVDELSFLNRLQECAKEENNDYAAAFMQDMDENGRIIFSNVIQVSSDLTLNFLKRKGFIWPKTDKRFIQKVLRYMKNTDYIRETKSLY